MNKSDLLHANTLKDLLKGKKTYLYTELRTLLELAIEVVTAGYGTGGELDATEKLEEFLR